MSRHGPSLLAAAVLLAWGGLAAAGGQADALMEKAKEQEALEHFAQAAALYEAALKLEPDQYFAAVMLGKDYSRLGRLEDAKRMFARARKINSGLSQAYIAEGYADEDAGRDDEARAMWAGLIAKDPDSFVGFHHMGAYWSRRGDSAKGEYYFRESLKRLEALPDQKAYHGDMMHTIFALASLLGRERKYDEAEALLRKGVELCRDDPADKAQCLSSLASIDADRGKRKEARRLLDQALALCAAKGACFRNAHANVLSDAADFYLDQGDKKRAEDATDEEAALYRPFGDIHLLALPFSLMQLDWIGQTYEKLGRDDKAEGVYREIVALRPSIANNQTLAVALGQLADVCERSGRLAEAASLDQDAIGILEKRRGIDTEAGRLEAERRAHLARLKTLTK